MVYLDGHWAASRSLSMQRQESDRGGVHLVREMVISIGKEVRDSTAVMTEWSFTMLFMLHSSCVLDNFMGAVAFFLEVVLIQFKS